MSVQGRPGFLGGPSNRRAGYHRVTWESGAYSYVHESEIMPRPKPSEPWVQVALRLTPAQAAKVQTLVDNSGGFSFSGAIRHMIECYEPLTREQVHEIMLNLNERVKHEPLQRWKAKPGSLLKNR